LNLLGNALKFTQRGSVTVQARYEPAETGDGTVCITVRDTGIGIPEALRASLFSPFSGAHRAGVDRERGTGLGLAICKRLCELMGGSIGVDSAEDKGSAFTIRLPTRPCEAVAGTDEAAP